MNKLEQYGKEFREEELYLRARGAVIEFLAFVCQTHPEKDGFDYHVELLRFFIDNVVNVLCSDEQNRDDQA